MKDFWASEKVLSRIFKNKKRGSVMANMLFGEPLKVLLLLDESHLLFTRDQDKNQNVQ